MNKSENIDAITKFLFIEDDNIKTSDLVLILCNNNINGIAEAFDKLYNQGVITENSKVIISGNHGPLDDFNEKECDLVKDILVNKHHYSSELFSLEDRATNIYENLLYSKELIGNMDDYNNILIIGAAFALRRIKMTASRLDYPIRKIRYYGTVNKEGTPIGKDNWWLNDKARLRVYQELKRIGEYLEKGDLDIFKEDL